MSPDVITDKKDFYIFQNISSKENYISKETQIGEIIELNKISNFKLVSNKFVLIENADPGYDFLFSYNIKGLVTKYGGSNSHMAIRCMELGLPAIIGVGDRVYKDFARSKKVYIDCNNKVLNNSLMKSVLSPKIKIDQFKKLILLLMKIYLIYKRFRTKYSTNFIQKNIKLTFKILVLLVGLS